MLTLIHYSYHSRDAMGWYVEVEYSSIFIFVSVREHVKISTLDENVNRLTFEPDPPPPLNVNRP